MITQVGRPDDGTDPKGPNNLEILADLQPRSTWRFADKDALVADMAAKIHATPGLPTNFSQVIQDNVEEALSGAKGEIVVKVFGPDLVILEDLASRGGCAEWHPRRDRRRRDQDRRAERSRHHA